MAAIKKITGNAVPGFCYCNREQRTSAEVMNFVFLDSIQAAATFISIRTAVVFRISVHHI
jgi:hypothetical protein